jgi:hypothetical protein
LATLGFDGDTRVLLPAILNNLPDFVQSLQQIGLRVGVFLVASDAFKLPVVGRSDALFDERSRLGPLAACLGKGERPPLRRACASSSFSPLGAIA